MNHLRLLLAMVCVSSAALFASRALQELTPLAIAAWRLGFASLFFIVWEITSRGKDRDRKAMTGGNQVRLVLAGVFLALHFLFWFASLQLIPIARSTLLVCTTPLWTALGGFFWKRQPPPRVYWPALGMAAVGIWLVTRAAAEPHTTLSLRGDMLAVAGGASIAAYLLSVEGLHTTLSARRQVTVAYSVAAAALWGALLLQGGPGLHYSTGAWAAILGMALGPQIVGHTLLNGALRYFTSSTVAFATLMEPIIAAILAWLLLHQAITAGQMAGGALVMVGLALIAQKQDTEPDFVPAG